VLSARQREKKSKDLLFCFYLSLRVPRRRFLCTSAEGVVIAGKWV
jgi:hypothetical protein